MIRPEKYDKMWAGASAGFLIPVIIGFCVYFFSSGDKTIAAYFERLAKADIVTHIVSLCVFPNIFLFLLFNRLDMLRATKGVLGITIMWAILVFAPKFLL